MDELNSKWFRTVTGGSEMGELIASIDWAAHPLGSPSTWPPALRTAVGLCLTSRFPMLVVWGPELYKFYNDGYREILGTKHPQAMGAPAREIWPEIWDTIGPMFASVMQGDGPTWVEDGLLEIDRHGFVEECYFTYSYSPILTEDGEIVGVLDTVTETTDQVVDARRLQCLGELAVELVDTAGVADVCMGGVSVLERHAADITFADVYLDAGEAHVRFASTRWEGAVHSVRSDLLRRVADDQVSIVVDADPGSDVAADQRILLAPIGEQGDGLVNGVLALGLNPRRPMDDGYRSFLGLVAKSIGNGLTSASRRTSELGEQRRISDALQVSMLSPAATQPGTATRYVPALGNISVGGDWYDFVELEGGRTALLVGDCVGHGLEAATVMGQLRSASRALLLEGQGPAATLESLDRFAASMGGADCTTVFCGIADPSGSSFTYTTAGHPPPLLARRGESVWLDGARGIPLGIDRSLARDETTVDLRAEDTIVLYTDGLVERRREALDVSLDRLRRVADEHADEPVDVLADNLLTELLTDGARDDVALLIHRPSDAAG